jgi:hypothetical protein
MSTRDMRRKKGAGTVADQAAVFKDRQKDAVVMVERIVEPLVVFASLADTVNERAREYIVVRHCSP